MKLVRESINFERGKDPLDTLEMGKYRPEEKLRRKNERHIDLEQRLFRDFPGLINPQEKIVYTSHSGEIHVTNYIIVNTSDNYWRKTLKEWFEKDHNFNFVSLKLEKTNPYMSLPFLKFEYIGD